MVPQGRIGLDQRSEASSDHAPVRVTESRSQRGGLRFAVSLAYRVVAQHFTTMVMAAAMVVLPFLTVLAVSTTVLLGRRAMIVNSTVQASGDVGLAYGIWTAALLLTYGLGLLFAHASIVIMVAGQLMDRPITPMAAMKATLRRRRTLVSLLVIALVAVVAILTFAIVVGRTDAPLPLFYAALAIPPVVALPYTTALPAAVLEGHSAIHAFTRVHKVLGHRWYRTSIALLLATAPFGALAGAATELAAALPDGLAYTLLDQIAQTVLAVVTVPFSAAVLTTVFLYDDGGRRRARGWADRALIHTRLHAVGSDEAQVTTSRRRIVAVVAALALPGLLVTSYAWANPLHLATVTDYELHTTAGRQVSVPPRLHYDRDGRPIVLYSNALLACVNPQCSRNVAADFHIPLGVSLAIPSGVPYATAGTATLPDGRIAIAAWSWMRRGDEQLGLQLHSCSTDRCHPADNAPEPVLIDAAGPDPAWGHAAATAVTPTGAIVVAHIRFPEQGDEQVLSLTICADLRCVQPSTVELTPVQLGLISPGARPLAIAVAPNGTAVVAYLDVSSGAVTIAVCDDRQCRNPTVTMPVAPLLTGLDSLNAENGTWPGLDVVVRPDGTPMVAYRDSSTGATHLLDCHRRDCATVNDIALTEPDRNTPAPALTLDRAGRPLIATHDVGHNRLMLITCADTRCTKRTTLPVANLAHRPGYLDINLTPAGRPQVARTDAFPGIFGMNFGPTSVRLTTCVTPNCR